jgi:hypothetical protein
VVGDLNGSAVGGVSGAEHSHDGDALAEPERARLSGIGHAHLQLVAEAIDVDAETLKGSDRVPAQLAGLGELGASG